MSVSSDKVFKAQMIFVNGIVLNLDGQESILSKIGPFLKSLFSDPLFVRFIITFVVGLALTWMLKSESLGCLIGILLVVGGIILWRVTGMIVPIVYTSGYFLGCLIIWGVRSKRSDRPQQKHVRQAPSRQSSYDLDFDDIDIEEEHDWNDEEHEDWEDEL